MTDTQQIEAFAARIDAEAVARVSGECTHDWDAATEMLHFRLEAAGHVAGLIVRLAALALIQDQERDAVRLVESLVKEWRRSHVKGTR